MTARRRLGLVQGIDRVGTAVHRPGKPLLQGLPRAGRRASAIRIWPDLKPAKIFKLAFRDKGRLIDSTEHPAVQEVGSP